MVNPMGPDEELLLRFADQGDEQAFTELVRRRIDFVYAVALRQVGGDAHLAQDAAQEVFLDLARKARAVAAGPALVSWLYTATRFAAAKARRRQTRWLNREQESLTMKAILSEGIDPSWENLRPVLDDAMHELNQEDRTALLLRYFENRPLAEIGTRLGLAENTARMRVERALDKLRDRLSKRGIASTAAALGSVLAAQPAITAPIGLATAAATGALTAAVTGSTVVTGSLLFAMNKTIVVTLGVLLLATIATVVVVEHYEDPASKNTPVLGPGVVAPTKLAAATAVSVVPGTMSGQPTNVAAASPAGPAGTPLDLDNLLEEMKKRDASVAQANTAIQALLAAGTKTNIAPSSAPASSVNPAAIASLMDHVAALQYFRSIATEDLPAQFQYIFTITPKDHRDQLLVPALFQSWTERDAPAAITAASQAGELMLSRALAGWARTDLQAAWNWTEAAPETWRLIDRSAVIEGGVAAGKEATIIAWLQARAASLSENERSSAFSALVQGWAAKDLSAAQAWTKEMEAAYPGSTSQAVMALGNHAANLTPAEFSRLLEGQDDATWKRMAQGAVISWVSKNQMDRLRQFLAQTDSLTDERHDAVLVSMGVVVQAMKDPDLALEAYQLIREPKQRDRSLNSLAASTIRIKPEFAMQVALKLQDRTAQATRLIDTYRTWKANDPAAARKALDQPGFPADVRSKLLEQE
jgi:RNA polymerase sigma factor (sigma-70 family)